MRLELRFPQGKSRALTLSYDDGVTTDIPLVQMMDKYGIKGTFNIDTATFPDAPTEYPKGKWGRMTREQCLELYASPNAEVAVHTRTHPFLTKLPGAQVMLEVVNDREVIEDMFGEPCRGMAYPYGAFNDEVVEILKHSGIVYSRTTISNLKFDIPKDWLRLEATCHHKNPKLMELAESFLADGDRYGRARLFYLWGHSYEFESDDNWEVIEEFFKKVSGHEDVWYATNIELYDYIQAYNGLIFSVNMNTVQNNSATDVWFMLNGEMKFAPAGKVTKLD